jgi:hypothetical protein
MILPNVDSARRHLPKHACPEIEVLPRPLLFKYQESPAEVRLRIAEASLQPSQGLSPAEPVR